jgi:hypothetical protein
MVIVLLLALFAMITRGRGNREKEIALQEIRNNSRLGPKMAEWLEANEGKLEQVYMQETKKQSGGSRASSEQPAVTPSQAHPPKPEATASAQVQTKISDQRQLRHLKDKKEYKDGSYVDSADDAQKVLDAYHSGDATILGTTRAGHTVVRYDGVTGTNVNIGANYPSQPTNVFIIKGTAHPSVVPTDPTWSP